MESYHQIYYSAEIHASGPKNLRKKNVLMTKLVMNISSGII